MKKLFLYLLLAGFLTALLSCNVQGTVWDSETVAKDLTDMRSVLMGMEVTMALAVEPDNPDDFGARTLNPGAVNVDYATHLQDGAGDYLSPATIYTNFGSTGTDEVRVPASGYLNDYNNNQGVQAYFFISPDSSDNYRIKLYIFPRADFTVKYNYEEYLVDNSNSGNEWEHFDEDGTAGKLISYKSYLGDNTVAERNIEWSNGGSGSYGVFSVGEDILNTNFDQYDFPSTISEPARDSNAVWSEYTKSTIARNGKVIDEFYTEPVSGVFSTITYISQDRWSRSKNTVIRSEGNYSIGSEKINSLSTTGNQWSGWLTETDKVNKSLTDNKINYSREYNLWWSDVETAKTASRSSYRLELALTETAVDSNSYSGSITEYWGSIGGSYNVVLTNHNNGSYSYKRSGWSFISRRAESDLEITLNQSDDLSFSIPVGTGIFTGNLIQSELVGIYESNGSTASVSVNSMGITVDNTDFTYEQLAD